MTTGLFPGGAYPDPPGDWTRYAACQYVADGTLFFPKPGHSTVEQAKAICRTCPVCCDCLEYALSVPGPADHGVWGGTSKHEREVLRSQRRRQNVALPPPGRQGQW